MFNDYFKQSATWKRQNGTDQYGQPVYVSQTINCRWEANLKLVRDTYGQQVVSNGSVFCLQNIQPGDLLNDGTRDWVVIGASNNPDINGVSVYTEAYV